MSELLNMLNARNRLCNSCVFYRILDSADIEKVTHESHKRTLNHGRVVRNLTLADNEKNLEIDPPRCGKSLWVVIFEAWRTHESQKAYFTDAFFFQGGAEQGIRGTGVWSLKRWWSSIKQVIQ